MPNPTLDNYYTTPISPYVDPRTPGNLCLIGVVRGHHKKADGTKVQTSSIVNDNLASGRTIATASGTVYDLLTPDSGWLEWMKENGVKFDPDNPIRTIKGDDE